MIPGWICSRPPRQPPLCSFASVTTSPTDSSGTSRTSSRTGPTGRRPTTSSRRKIGAYAALQGTLAQGADRLLAAMKLSDDIGQLTYKVWYFASLKHDEDQRDNQINARRQQVQILFAKASQASAWFNPELLQIPLPTVQQWMSANPELAVYRFAHRGSLPPAGARARREGRAPALAGEPILVGAERRLCRALDRRRQAPGRSSSRPDPRSR